MVETSKSPSNTSCVPASTEAMPVKALNTDDVLFLSKSIAVFVRALELCGFDSYGYSTKPTLDHWVQCASEIGPIAFLKYKTAAFYAACRGIYFADPQDIPLKPFQTEDKPHILLGGRAYRWVQYLAKTNLVKLETVCTTVLGIKKGLPRAGEALLFKAKVDTFIDLTTPSVPSIPIQLVRWADMGDDPVFDKAYLTQESFCRELERTVDEVFKNALYTDEDRFTPFFPSTSANYINSRSKGGAVGYIMNDVSLIRDLKTNDVNDLIRISFNELNKNDTNIPVYTCDVSGLYNKWEVLYKRMLLAAIDEVPFAVPVALSEPLKVRVITKGPPLLNTVLKPLQKFLWRTMKVQPTFHLIGSWIELPFLQKRLGLIKNGFKWLSVDYKNATNEMHSWVSECIARRIAMIIQLTDIEEELFVRALTRHIMVDPRDKHNFDYQKKGQLMGSIVSFPVLCIANATILRLTRELDCGRKFSLDQSGILVNGDDGLLKATLKGKEYWEKIASFSGLKPSVGKVYFSEQFFNINSTTFRYNPIPVDTYSSFIKDTLETKIRPIHFTLVKYVNMGLFYDMERSSSADTNSSISVTSIGERANELMRTCPDDLKTVVLDGYIGRHLKLLVSLNVPWFIPAEFGGLGLPIGVEKRHQPNELQLRIAHKLYILNLKVPTIRPTDVWRTWKVALKLMPKDLFNPFDIIMSSARLNRQGLIGEDQNVLRDKDKYLWSVTGIRSLYVISTLFTNNFEDLYDDLESNKHTIERNYYRKLQRINQLVSMESKYSHLPLYKVQPLDPNKLPSLRAVSIDELPFASSTHPFFAYDYADKVEEWIAIGGDVSELPAPTFEDTELGYNGRI